MPDVLKVKTFQSDSLPGLETLMNAWLASDNLSTQMYADLKITTVCIKPANALSDAKFAYTAIFVYRKRT
jgi:hypothetical protein